MASWWAGQGNVKSVISKKWQVTVPKKIRDEMGIRAGQELQLKAWKGTLVARKIVASKALERVTGLLSGRIKSTDKYLKGIRGPRQSSKILK